MREDTHYVKAMIQGAVVGVEEKLVGSMQAQTTRLMMKHCRAGAQGKPLMQRLGIQRREGGTTHANELVQEDAAEVRAGGNVGCENASGAARREHDGVELSGGS